MKRIIAFVLVLCLAFTLAACAKTPDQLMEEGTAALEAGDYQKAIDSFNKLLKAEPENVEALTALAEAQYMSGDNESFVSVYDKLVALGADTSELEDRWLEVTNHEIVWADATLEAYVREYLGKPDGTIMRNELNGIGAIVIFADQYRFLPVGTSTEETEEVYYEFEDIKWAQGEGVGYEYSDEDKSDWYYLGGSISSAEDFANFAKMTYLECDYNNISDLTPFAELTWLKALWIWGDNITDITPLAGLTGLETLNLAYNNIPDLTPLAGLTGLETLYLNDNNIIDITPLAELTGLKALFLFGNNISDLTPLAGLTGLTELSLYNNNISDITPLAGLTALKTLRLFENNITDITPLEGLTGLETLWLNDNNITDITPLAGLTALKKLGLSNNNITDITPLAGLTELKMLWLNNNNISSADVSWLGKQLPNCGISDTDD